jgi:3-polyprenyl-4-hydroxybenzoate decarboxylase
LGDAASLETLASFLRTKYGDDVDAGTINLHSNRDLGATIASGSHACAGMAIVPCSMKTLAAVANGLSRSLITCGGRHTKSDERWCSSQGRRR